MRTRFYRIERADDLTFSPVCAVLTGCARAPSRRNDTSLACITLAVAGSSAPSERIPPWTLRTRCIPLGIFVCSRATLLHNASELVWETSPCVRIWGVQGIVVFAMRTHRAKLPIWTCIAFCAFALRNVFTARGRGSYTLTLN
jgi:hypothetical protein